MSCWSIDIHPLQFPTQRLQFVLFSHGRKQQNKKDDDNLCTAPSHAHIPINSEHHPPLPSPMASTNHRPFRCSFHSWMAQQQQDLDELVAANSPATDKEDLARLRDKCVAHFGEYAERRAAMARQNPPCFLSPPWCSALQNAFISREYHVVPQHLTCLVLRSFTLFNFIAHIHPDSSVDGNIGERMGNLADLTARQLVLINALHCKTVKEEDKFSTRITSLQEEIADEPLATMAKQSVGEVERAMAMVAHEAAMAEVLLAADRLRMETLKEVMGILTPLQAVDLLIAGKKLHISMHCWGCKREEQTSTTTN
ncbi:hypothetical protein SASPL_139304 [Salvia splendens]|uniref:DOG1 domain-containing protein n=1 Tax=Salvia splendens TaxID=180675 RepID=A0A8X8WPT1_SALSN|nr:hypothetical protein SASPL_139304 [Salvia splendens]